MNRPSTGRADALAIALSFTPAGESIYAASVKRFIDILIASIAMMVVAPIILACAILISLDTPGHAFFKQKRVGAKGRIFEILKLRTMYKGADRHGCRTADDDGRVTRIGAFLRKTKIDELPQLLNILRGDMSVIGPRPLSVDETELLLSEGYSQATPGFYPTARPGLIGLEQSHRYRKLSYAERFKLNDTYEQNLSWQLDLDIFLRSLWQCRYVVYTAVTAALVELSFVANVGI